MENKITNQAKSVLINNKEFPRNTLSIETKEGSVFVKTISEGKTVAQGAFGSWRNSADTQYATESALITDLRAYLFA